MADWFTSDTHFGHENVLKYCNRPYPNVEAMNEDLIRRWNARVQPHDTVFHLGDFALGPKVRWPEYRLALNGRIIFTLGNHDTIALEQFKAALLPDDDVHRHLNIRTQAEGRLYRIHCAHTPTGPQWHEERPDTVPLRPELPLSVKADYEFCGHVHTAWRRHPTTGCINVGVDVWDYQPVSLAEILAGINQEEGISHGRTT